jgi:hypothetical protein
MSTALLTFLVNLVCLLLFPVCHARALMLGQALEADSMSRILYSPVNTNPGATK